MKSMKILLVLCGALFSTQLLAGPDDYAHADFLDKIVIAKRSEPPREIRRGRDFSYQLYLQNLTDEHLYGIDFYERFEGFSVSRITPNGAISKHSVSWKNVSIPPRATVTFTVYAKKDSCCNGKMQQTSTVQWGNSSLNRSGYRGILIDRQMLPEIIPRNQELTYKILVKNLRNEPVSGIELKEETAGVQIVASKPEAAVESQTLYWRNINLAAANNPGSEQIFYVTIKALDLGAFNLCFGLKHCNQFNVGQPELVLTKTCPPESGLCDAFTYTFKVQNKGLITAKNVMIDDRLPEGLLTQDNRQDIGIYVGDMAPGAAREYTVPVKATCVGVYSNTARAYESNNRCGQNQQTGPIENGVQTSASASIEIKNAALSVIKSGPNMRYLGRPIEYEIEVRNTGNMPTSWIQVYDELPSHGAQFISASDDGKIVGNHVIWKIPSLNIGESRTVRVQYRATGVCLIETTAGAQAKCAEASVTASTQIRGMSALLLEVVDTHDPIEIDANEAYIISVTNQGSAVATNIRIRAEVPAEMKIIGAVAPNARTATQVSGQVIEFEPLPSLQPHAVATYRVQVKGQQEGDVRFKVQMNADELTSDVTETESTHIYR